MTQTQSSIYQNTICKEPDSISEYGPAYKSRNQKLRTVNSFLHNMKKTSHYSASESAHSTVQTTVTIRSKDLGLRLLLEKPSFQPSLD